MTRYMKGAILGSAVATLDIRDSSESRIVFSGETCNHKAKAVVEFRKFEIPNLINQIRNFVDAGCKNEIEIFPEDSKDSLQITPDAGGGKKKCRVVLYNYKSQLWHFGLYRIEDLFELLKSI